MQALNLPTFDFRIEEKALKKFIFDPIRKKLVSLSPEEWVRQHLIQFLINYQHCPKSLLAVEIGLSYNQLSKRADIVVYNRDGSIWMLVEVKAPYVKLDEKALNQVATYHKSLPAQYLLISNGLEHYCLRIGQENISFLTEIPSFESV